MLLPRYYYQLVLGKLYIVHLRKIDLKVRRFVREILHFLHDTPSSGFHAHVKLLYGATCLRWTVPMMALQRLSVDRERILWLTTARNGSRLTSKVRIDSFFKRDLHSRCNGAGLRRTSAAPAALAWFYDGGFFLTGNNFISLIHVKYVCLFTMFRVASGREADELCSHGCRVAEILNHVSQH